jgi:hypothetical protein
VSGNRYKSEHISAPWEKMIRKEPPAPWEKMIRKEPPPPEEGSKTDADPIAAAKAKAMEDYWRT